MLEVTRLNAWYGQAQVVRDVSFTIEAGEVLAIVGPNGAGKSTLTRSVVGLHAAQSGRVSVEGREVGGGGATAAARAGVGFVPQGRRIFRSLTVGEHLAIAERHGRGSAKPVSRDELFAQFPRLAERLDVRARALSGGEQQMLAIARAVATGPSVLVLDEPTEGLSPSMVQTVGGLVRHLAGTGVAVLLAEQQGAFPGTVADRVVEMHRGALAAPVAAGIGARR